MTEAQLFEKIGRLQASLDEANANYDKLLLIFSEVISGKCERSRVLVNLTDRTYLWADKGQRPATPATINGLPVCVIAPEEAE